MATISREWHFSLKEESIQLILGQFNRFFRSCVSMSSFSDLSSRAPPPEYKPLGRATEMTADGLCTTSNSAFATLHNTLLVLSLFPQPSTITSHNTPSTESMSDDDYSDESCSSLTSSSGDTFHVFTDASVSISKPATPAVTKELFGERQKLQTEREKLERERQQLAEERKKLEEERRQLRRSNSVEGEVASNDKKAKKVDAKIKSLSEERRKLEQQDKLRRRMERLEEKERQRLQEQQQRRKELDHSGHVLKESRRSLRRISKDSDELKKVNDALDKDSAHMDNLSIDLEEEINKDAMKRKELEDQRKRMEEENRRQILEKARAKVQKERQQRQEMIRERIAAEEAEAKRKMQLKKDEERKKAEKKKEQENTPKARMERAYGWYSKLALPKRDVMKKKVQLIASIDITEDDVDLLPWNAAGTMVNVAKLNSMLYTR